MQLSTTFRHMDASQAVREYAEERLEKIKKYFQRDPLQAHAVFSVERNHYHTAEFVITLANGILIQAKETTEDMYSSIDLAGSRIERQVRKWKDKIRDHKPHGDPSFSIRQRVLSADTLDPQPDARASEAAAEQKRVPTAPPAPAFSVVKEQTFSVRRMRVEDAVMQMNLLENDFLVFTDIDTKGISVVYRRKDGNYGLIETGARGPSSSLPIVSSKRPARTIAMKVVDFLRPDLVIPELNGGSKSEVLGEMSRHLAQNQAGVDSEVLRRVLEDRELLASTAIGDGIAIPHGKLDSVTQLVGTLGRSVSGLEFDSIDGKPTHLVFMLVAPASSTGIHLKALARLSRLFRDAVFRQRLIEAADGPGMYRVITEEDAKY